jgi:hypothetical protein
MIQVLQGPRRSRHRLPSYPILHSWSMLLLLLLRVKRLFAAMDLLAKKIDQLK